MEVYKNDYSKEEDLALWVLHDIRHKMARRGLSAADINKSARDLIRKRRLSNLRLVRTVLGV
jgi:hypothetical protein